MQVLSCSRCIPEVSVPNEVLNDVCEELCALVRQNQRLQGLMVLKRKQIPLVDAKFIVLHLAGADGTCHRCHTPLEGEGAQECKHCRSLNLKWCE